MHSLIVCFGALRDWLDTLAGVRMGRDGMDLIDASGLQIVMIDVFS